MLDVIAYGKDCVSLISVSFVPDFKDSLVHPMRPKWQAIFFEKKLISTLPPAVWKPGNLEAHTQATI